MCGRYTLTQSDPHPLADRFGFEAAAVAPATLGRFNVCPTEQVLAAAAGGACALRWGLAAPRAGGREWINARSETAAFKGMFARLLARPEQRCLVIADGWYEWLRPEHPKGERVPFRYTVDGGAPFAFAGLHDRGGVAILTTAANAICAPVHDRMPCVLAGPEAEVAWLTAALEPGDTAELLAPLAAARIAAAPANPAVNRAGVEGPELLTPPAPPLTLFG